MRKTILYTLLLAGALLMPNEAAELGKMKPVEAVCIRQEDDTVIIETDMEDVGRGTTVAQAMENLKATTAGTIFLDTADFLLVMEGAEPLLPQISGYLKQGIRVCGAEEKVTAADAAEFLRVHKPSIKLRDWHDEKSLEVLKIENGCLILK